MAADEYWLPERHVRPRLSRDELWTLYRLVDNRYWQMRGEKRSSVYFMRVRRLRLKLVRDVNKMRTPEHQISARQRIY